MATIIDGDNKIPFMRGMLVQYLIQRSIGHKEARDIANEVRQRLTKIEDIEKSEMLDLVRDVVNAFDIGGRLGDLQFWERQITQIVVEGEEGKGPFSKGLHARLIERTGLAADSAYSTSVALEDQLIERRVEIISEEELTSYTVKLIAASHGQLYADRYRTWGTWGKKNRPIIILICGPSGAGKTTLAISLANILNIPRVVATDDIRQMMRLTLTTELMPTLHASTYNAWECMPKDSEKELRVITGFRDQARAICVGVEAIISRCMSENTSVVVDGVHLLPDLLNITSFSDSALVIPLCIGLNDRKEYEKRFRRRSKQAPERSMHRYLKYLDEIFLIQDHILGTYFDAGYPVLHSTVFEDLKMDAINCVCEILLRYEEDFGIVE
ncbi:MAG: hypothetical protein VX294_06830 [Candidatus Latescibacterota bacterium]|nr:hypothetical protein [Candidatus Latescibacterota bacterium]